ncbi:MAG: sucrase ferredoxin [Myxococcota bacterium]|nr:sucrase ferredoxin [Myxococcota bacterium]
MSESCSEQSLIQSESLVGTAPGPITHWICIELPGAWPARFKPNTLSLPPALAALTDIAGRPHHKLLLIRGRRPTPRKTIRVFVSQPALDRVRSWEVDVSGPFIDWDSRLKQDSGHHLTHPLILVCTHGSRDRCCGILGGATFAALHTINPDWVWQVSHLGGHRFAPTLLSLPSGQLYGRVTADMAVDFMNALSRGEPFDFGHLRGNTQFAPAVQAVLAHLGRQTTDSFTVKQEAEYTRVNLFHGDESVVAVAQRCPTGQSACASCADVTPRPIMRWHVEVETA